VSEMNKGQKTKVLMAFSADWIGRESGGSMEANWFNGGKLRITRLVKARRDRPLRPARQQRQQDRLGNGADG